MRKTPFPSHSRSLALPEEDGVDGHLKDDLLDLAGDWFQTEVKVMVEGEGRGVAYHVD